MYYYGVYLCALGYRFSKKEKLNVYDKCVVRPEMAHICISLHYGFVYFHNKQGQGILWSEKNGYKE